MEGSSSVQGAVTVPDWTIITTLQFVAKLSKLKLPKSNVTAPVAWHIGEANYSPVTEPNSKNNIDTHKLWSVSTLACLHKQIHLTPEKQHINIILLFLWSWDCKIIIQHTLSRCKEQKPRMLRKVCSVGMMQFTGVEMPAMRHVFLFKEYYINCLMHYAFLF